MDDAVITLKYLNRYPTSKQTKSWEGCSVKIETEHGFWRWDAKGYTFRDRQDCWILPFEEAWDNIYGLGPEKKAKLYKV